MDEQPNIQQLASEIKMIKDSLLSIQDFLGTLNINNNGKPNSRDMKVQFDEEHK